MDESSPSQTEVETPSIVASGLYLEPFVEADSDKWDELISRSCNGTFSLTRRYLGYHGDRFVDRSLFILDTKGRLRGVLPAAVGRDDGSSVISHPGNTYGGLVHDGSIRGEAMIEALSLAISRYKELGHRRFVYRPVPPLFHRYLMGDDSYALFRLGASRTSCSLCAVIDLRHRMRPRKGRIGPLRKAERLGVSAYWGWEAIGEFWPILESNLKDRFGSTPTHTLEEINEIHGLFPNEVRLVVARHEEQAVSGAIFYLVNSVMHLQYFASNDSGTNSGGTDMAIESAIALAQELGCNHYSFGTSNEEHGQVLNQSLYAFKLSFGAGSVPFEEFSVDL